MRRTITIIAAIIVALGILAGIYFFFFYNQGPSLAVDTTGGNPFGAPSGQATGSGTGSDTNASVSADGGNIPSQVAPKLVEISSTPVGKGFIALDASTTPVIGADGAPANTSAGVEVRYIDRENGNMYAYGSITSSITRLTNHTVPGVEEVSWLPDGSAAYVRFLSGADSTGEHIQTYRLPADGSDGSFLAEDLSEVIPESLSSIFALAPNSSGSVGYIEKADGTNPVTLFSSLLSSLSVRNSAGAMAAYTKPSANLAGYAFLVDKKSGAFASILGPLTGLSALPSPSGQTVLISYLSQGAVRLAFYDTKTHSTTALPVATLTDKCVWAADSSAIYCAVPTALPSVSLPDSWYQGTVSFSDRIWRIDFTARVATLTADLPTLTDTPIDAVSLTLDANERTLVFMNKADDSLWAYSL